MPHGPVVGKGPREKVLTDGRNQLDEREKVLTDAPHGPVVRKGLDRPVVMNGPREKVLPDGPLVRNQLEKDGPVVRDEREKELTDTPLGPGVGKALDTPHEPIVGKELKKDLIDTPHGPVVKQVVQGCRGNLHRHMARPLTLTTKISHPSPQ